MDNQHKELFGALNNFIKACDAGNKEDFNNCISFLGNYVVKHFAEEEEIQKSFDYPDYPHHRQIHEDYKTAVGGFAAKWLAAGPSDEVLKEIRTHIGSWLVNHIKAQDVKIGAFIRSKKDVK
ncbi:MAG: hemerythrin family protein [Treponema sp.]|nr:hemerythrin family protein [Treponema sp.]